MTEDIAEAARFIARRLKSSHQGAIYAPGAWIAVGGDRGHIIIPFCAPGGPVGEYLSSEAGTGVVCYNIAYGATIQCHALVHEMAHAEIDKLASSLHRGQVPGFLAGRSCRSSYDDGPGDAAHKVACMVEMLCLQTAELP